MDSNPRRLVVLEGTHPTASRQALHAIAFIEALKGLAALAGIIGVLDLMHHDVRHLAIELIGRFGSNPDARYSSLLLHYADLLTGADVGSLLRLAGAYICLRFLEAYGLWRDRAWGEWLGCAIWWSLHTLRVRAPHASLFVDHRRCVDRERLHGCFSRVSIVAQKRAYHVSRKRQEQ